MIKKRILLFSVFLLLFITMSFAYEERDDFFAQNSVVDLNYPCNFDNAPCPADTSCNLTILYPNKTRLVTNGIMTNNYPSKYFNYTILMPDSFGEHKVDMQCESGGVFGTEIFYFTLNEFGVRENPYSIFGAIIALIVMTVVYLYSAFKMKDQKIMVRVKYTLYMLSFVNVVSAIIIAKLMTNNYYGINNVLDGMLWANIALILYIFYHLLRQWLLFKQNEKDKEYR